MRVGGAGGGGGSGGRCTLEVLTLSSSLAIRARKRSVRIIWAASFVFGRGTPRARAAHEVDRR